MGITVLQLHKRASYEFKYIQDKYAINTEKNVFALADGTTQSFNSELWAALITNAFVANPTFIVADLIGLLSKQVDAFRNSEFQFSSNPAKAALEKSKRSQGGTATFLGFQFRDESKIDVISCGDTNLFILSSDEKLISFPFATVDELDANDKFINTENLYQKKVSEPFFFQKTIERTPSDILIVATDALSRFILSKRSAISELLVINTFDEFHAFCLKYWECKELQEDDISAIIITSNRQPAIRYVHPPDGFSFPREKEFEFVPSELNQSSQSKYTEMEINEIRSRYNAVVQELNQVRKKQKSHEMLLAITISLLVANIVILILLFTTKPKTETPVAKPKIEEKKIDTKGAGLNSDNPKPKTNVVTPAPKAVAPKTAPKDLNNNVKQTTTKITVKEQTIKQGTSNH